MYTATNSDYQKWLDAKVWINGLYKSSRKDYIPSFTYSIKNWMKKKGYTMNGNFTPRLVAKWLYAIQIQEVAKRNFMGPIYYPEPYHRDWEEDHDTFDMEVSYEDCTSFLQSFRANEDLDTSGRAGYRVSIELQDFLYTYLDLETSKHGIRIAELLQDSDTESDGEGEGIDSYLQDARDGWHS